MDPKKQDLNPELKEIYDRVMNTQVKPNAPTATTPPPQTPTSAATPIASAPSAVPPIGSPVMPPAGSPTTPQPNQGPTQAGIPQPGVESKPFVFTGNKVTTPQATTSPQLNQAQIHTSSGKKLSTPVIAVLVVILIVVWALFWAKIFGLI